MEDKKKQALKEISRVTEVQASEIIEEDILNDDSLGDALVRFSKIFHHGVRLEGWAADWSFFPTHLKKSKAGTLFIKGRFTVEGGQVAVSSFPLDRPWVPKQGV